MNLQEFLSHRNICPLCDCQMNIFFHSDRRQSNRIEGNRLNCLFELKDMGPKMNSHKVAYSFSLLDNSFQLEFYTEHGDHYRDLTPMFLRNKALELHQNLSKAQDKFSFLKVCAACAGYACSTTNFNFELKDGLLPLFEMGAERIQFIQPTSDGDYRIMRLDNSTRAKRSQFSFGKSKTDEFDVYTRAPAGMTTLDLALIPFVSKEETMRRLSNLIIFS